QSAQQALVGSWSHTSDTYRLGRWFTRGPARENQRYSFSLARLTSSAEAETRRPSGWTCTPLIRESSGRPFTGTVKVNACCTSDSGMVLPLVLTLSGTTLTLRPCGSTCTVAVTVRVKPKTVTGPWTSSAEPFAETFIPLGASLSTSS